MSEQKNPKPAPRLLEKSPMSGIAVPIAIVLVGALIIVGVTKMLTTGKNHRDLIEEMNSKTFGNRWVAAYELSKFLAGQKIPKEDIPWVIENLSGVYRGTVDHRTRNFVVLALGSLKNPLTLPTLNAALDDVDPQTKFNAVVALGNLPQSEGVEFAKIDALTKQDQDVGLAQVALFTLATHKRPEAKDRALALLQSSEKTLRYAAAIVLIQFKDRQALPVLNEIMNLRYDVAKAGELNGAQVENLKLNVLENVEKAKWVEVKDLVAKTESTDSNVKVNTKAKLTLKILKN